MGQSLNSCYELHLCCLSCYDTSMKITSVHSQNIGSVISLFCSVFCSMLLIYCWCLVPKWCQNRCVSLLIHQPSVSQPFLACDTIFRAENFCGPDFLHVCACPSTHIVISCSFLRPTRKARQVNMALCILYIYLSILI